MFLISLVTIPFVPTVHAQDTDQTIIYATPYQIGGYSYWTAESYYTAQWSGAIYAGLYQRSPLNDYRFIPELASEMPQITVDGKTLIVELRDGLKFDNGNTVTADDVVFSYQMALTPLININSYSRLQEWFTNESVVKVDDNTISFTLPKPYGFALGLLTVPIIDQSLYGARYENCVGGEDIACTFNSENGSDTFGAAGPYNLKTIDTTNQFVTVTKNYAYWDAENVWASEIVFKFIPSKEEALTELSTGIIDILDSQYVALPSEFTGLDVVNQSIISSAHQEFSINHIHPYFGTGEDIPDNGRVTDDAEQARLMRKAMSHLVDRDFAVDVVLDGLGMQATTIMPASSIGYDTSLQPHEYNITLARQIMQDIGFNYSDISDFNSSDPDAICGTTGSTDNCFFDITFMSPNTGPARNQWSPLYVSELPKIGIGVKDHYSVGWSSIIPRTFGYSGNSLVPLFDNGGFDLFQVGYGWSIDWNPDGLYNVDGLCNQSNSNYFCDNFYNFVNLTIEEKIDEYLTTLDFDHRVRMVKEVQAMLHHEIPVLAILYPMETWTWRSDVQGIEPLLIGRSEQDWGEVRKDNWETPATTETPTIPPTTDTIVTPDQPVSILSSYIVMALIVVTIAKQIKHRK